VDSLGVHDLFTAEVVAVHIDESVLNENGRLDAEKTNLFTYLSLTGEYWSLGEPLA
jgi:flavin reductase (DIM6/NTAB) family NADH-FMN oxidoreductase RutF